MAFHSEMLTCVLSQLVHMWYFVGTTLPPSLKTLTILSSVMAHFMPGIEDLDLCPPQITLAIDNLCTVLSFE